MDTRIDGSILSGKIVLLTGAGGGIGLEAAKAFAEMGAKVLIAEIDREKGKKAAEDITVKFPGAAFFLHTDLSDGTAIRKLCGDILARFGCPDIIFNNAAAVITGKIGEVSIEDWDLCYAVNLKAPVMLTSYFLEMMKERDSGCIVFVSSSGAAPYLAAYETFKTAQAEFSSALSMELEGTHVYTYTIAPGLVKTETAAKSIEAVAKAMGMTEQEFYLQNEEHILDVRDAGLGFALSVLKAEEYNGREISSVQALNDSQNRTDAVLSPDIADNIPAGLMDRIARTFISQYDGWKKRNIFERQWVLRDFRKQVGIPAETVRDMFEGVLKGQGIGNCQASVPYNVLEKLQHYWEHQLKLLSGFEKDGQKFMEYSREIRGWIDDIRTLLETIDTRN